MSDSGVYALCPSGLRSSSAATWCQTGLPLAVLEWEHTGRKQHRPLLRKLLPVAPGPAPLLASLAGLHFPRVVCERYFLMHYPPPQILFSLHSASTESQAAVSSPVKSSISMNTFQPPHQPLLQDAEEKAVPKRPEFLTVPHTFFQAGGQEGGKGQQRWRTENWIRYSNRLFKQCQVGKTADAKNRVKSASS